MSNFFLPRKGKAGHVVIDDDDFSHIMFLIGGLSGFGSYKLGGK